MTQQPWRNSSQPGWGQPSPWGQQPPRYAPQPQWAGARPPAYGGGSFRPPPRRRSPLKSLLLGLIVVTAIALAGLVAANVVAPSSDGDAPYANENYQAPPPDTNPPEIPYATDTGEVDGYLETNPFYAESAVAPVDCQGLDPISNAANASDAQLEEHFTGLTACLMAVWEPPMQAAKWELPRPTVTIYDRKVTTKCGSSGINAFYCAADQQVYYSKLLPQAVPAVTRTPWGVDIVMAHEFGHTLQARSGILITAHLATQDGSEQDQLVSSRRLEVQADCFSGMFISAFSRSQGIDQSDVAAIENTYKAIGDDTLSGKANVEGDHGLARSRLYWGQQGLGNTAVMACNTFTAPASAVR